MARKSQKGDGHSQKWRKQHPDKSRQYQLKRQYNITPADYDALLAKQGGVCRICGSDQPGRPGHKYFSVDHAHDSKKVRGLLCHNCNLVLGHARDRIEILESAIVYLKENHDDPS